MADKRPGDETTGRERGSAPTDEGGDAGEGAEATGKEAAGVEVLECAPVIETWDDLLDLEPGQQAYVPLPSPTAEAVWTWHQFLGGEAPPDRLAQAVRHILMGLYVNDAGAILLGLVDALNAFSRLLEAYEKPPGGAGDAEGPAGRGPWPAQTR